MMVQISLNDAERIAVTLRILVQHVPLPDNVHNNISATLTRLWTAIYEAKQTK